MSFAPVLQSKMTPHLSHPKYRPDIDGLRAVAVLSVVVFHASPVLMKGGFIGVDVFFVISGFLISTIIFENLDRGTFSFSEFYARRINRVFPALLLVLVANFSLGWFVLLSDEYKQLGKHIVGGASFISNFILWGEAGYFDNSAETKPLLHLWSLAIEEQFYIIWPFILWFAWKKKLNLLTITTALAFLSFFLNIRGLEGNSVATFYSPQTRFWELLSGGVLAWFVLYKKKTFASRRSRMDTWLVKIFYREDVAVASDGKTLANFISFVGFFFIISGFLVITKDVGFPGKWAAIPVLGAVFIILAGPQAWINKKILSNKILVWFGLISFPLYLWHWSLLSFARIIEGEIPSRHLRITAVLLSIVLAWLTYRFVERPIRLGGRSQAKVITLIVLMLISAGIGGATYLHDGLKFRAAAQNTEQLRQDKLKEEGRLRQIGIKAGTCQFNKTGLFSDIENFSKNWNCLSNDENLKDTKVLIFGDSHAADKSMGLRFNGFDVVQIGGAGCSMNPALAVDQRDYCLHLFDIAHRNQEKYEVILLSNNFPETEINNENLIQIFNYWKGSKQIFLFTPMPDFTAQMNDYIKNGKIRSSPDFSREDAFLSLVKHIDLPENFSIIKSSDIWCLNRKSSADFPCAFATDHHLLMIDGGHLSIDGAKIFGRNMLSHSDLRDVLNKP